jgi:hypothetical protein
MECVDKTGLGMSLLLLKLSAEKIGICFDE